MAIHALLQTKLGKSVKDASDREIYEALLTVVKELAEERENCPAKETDTGKKKIYYVSAEFLIGKLLSNNMINLGIYDEVKELLAENGKDLAAIEEIEPEPSLGNGGLGRLAACFLDSMASLGLPGDGIGLNYHLGLFKQEFADGLQKETPNPWIEKKNWLSDTGISYPVTFGNLTLQAKMYDIAVTGYENRTNKLHLFDVDTVDESIVKDGISFDKTDIAKNLTLFLYPDDSDEEGRMLRIYQQYFMVSSGAQLILDECVKKGSNLHDLYEYAVIQINDTHPTMIIPELIRLLVKKGIGMDEAIEIVSKTCAYTNHTILAEALEKWPITYLQKVVPQLVPIIEILDDKVRRKYADEKVVIIDKNDVVHMAHIDIHYGFSVNGVASLHTEILKQTELHAFYELYPEKFNNKTNGITFRRWLLHCNPRLSALLDASIGNGYRKENYNVTKAEKLIPATDISEQISLASKEASGTGNMKFMLNGAVTLGTEDGANVEIHELVGDDNIFIFGAKSEEVIAHYEKADYVAKDIYEKDAMVKEAVDFITSKELLSIGHEENLVRLQKEILNKDWFMTLLDFRSYVEAKEKAYKAYEDRSAFAEMMIVNIAKAGYFSSDRTIAEYNRDIWKV